MTAFVYIKRSSIYPVIKGIIPKIYHIISVELSLVFRGANYKNGT